MHEVLEKYFEKKEKERQSALEKEKNELLREEGLCEKIYVEEDAKDANYEWCEAEHKTKYYKLVPIKISDEEYEKIKKYTAKQEGTGNGVCTALNVIAWATFICGFLGGLFSGISTENYIGMIIFWLAALISGVFILGFAEIINLLQKIYNKNS